MNEHQIADIWLLVKEYVDKKAIESLAERYVELLADHGVFDRILKDTIGHDETLDSAIEYYLEQDNDEFDDRDDNEPLWDYEEDE